MDQYLNIFSQVQLGAYQDHGHAGTVLTDFRKPFGSEVTERAGTDDAVAEEEDISIFVAQGPEALQLPLREYEDKPDYNQADLFYRQTGGFIQRLCQLFPQKSTSAAYLSCLICGSQIQAC